MNDMIQTYLHIPADYPMGPTPLCWSTDGDAIEGQPGGTFAFTHEIALFLQGFINSRRLIHFAYVVHLFRLLGLGRNFIDEPGQDIRQLYQQAGGTLINAGAFAAQLCPWAPGVAEPVELDGTNRRWLTHTALLVFVSRATALKTALREMPEALPFPPEFFEKRVRKALAEYTPEEVRHWFRHGCGIVKAPGEELARELEIVKPRTLAGVLATLAQRQRLAGAIPMVAQMVSALALPPRRLDRNELPLGGYADVTTRGQPEHLLPSQFAIDDLEFVRRFASHELLYFRREEPHAQLREELLLLLDQGARTWGHVRLVLSAAVFALARRAVRHDIPVRIAATGTGGKLVDPLQCDDELLGTMVEASDLSLHPGEALEQVLLEPAEMARDVVLLTHPRNLSEPDVMAAARRVPRGTRLFAVGVDDDGRAQLVEMRRGAPVSISQFRVNRSSGPAEHPEPVGQHFPAWQGNIERVGFPFRFGITTRIHKFAFDRACSWLLVASGNGILHAHATNGSDTEVLPRGMLHNDVLTDVDAVLGLPAGFVVGGQIDMELVAMHYHWPERRCIAHVLGTAKGKRWQWFYLPQFHSVVVRSDSMCYGVDLATGDRAAYLGSGHRPDRRVEQACLFVWNQAPPEYPVSSKASDPVQQYIEAGWPTSVRFSGRRTAVSLETETGTLTVRLYPNPRSLDDTPTTCKIRKVTPLGDDRPVLQHCRLLSAQYSANVLAISSYLPSEPQAVTLRLFRLPDSSPICEYPQQRSSDAFALSGDGRWLARQIAEMQVAVHDLSKGSDPQSVTPVEKCHQNLRVELGDSWLAVRIGERTHIIDWEGASLRIESGLKERHLDLRRYCTARGLPYPSTLAGTADLKPAWSHVWYDRKRFTLSATWKLTVTIDVFGQIAVWSPAQELLCMFFVFRDKLAGWLPDGTRFGPASLTGGPATPGAPEKIAGVLRRATTSITGGRP